MAVCPSWAASARPRRSPRYLETPPVAKPRVVITADPELDDSNSLVRYLLYAPSFRTEGLIYASSQFHWKGDGKGTKGFVPGREYTRVGREICPCASWRWDPGRAFYRRRPGRLCQGLSEPEDA
ncbi:nucleoside hydrolase-like domain-containing protein [Caulobacter segnis]